MTRSFVTLAADTGITLAAVLRRHWQLSWTQAKQLVASGQVRVGGVPCRDGVKRLRAGLTISVGPAPSEKKPPPRRPRGERRPPEFCGV